MNTLDRSSVPYIGQDLERPVGRGEQQESMKSQDFCYNLGDGSMDLWPTWYSLRDEHVLNVMRSNGSGSDADAAGVIVGTTDATTMNPAMKILTTGKYWNATSLCKHRDKRAAQIVRLPSSPSSTTTSPMEIMGGSAGSSTSGWVDGHDGSHAPPPPSRTGC